MPTIVMGKSSKPEQSKSFTPTAAGSVITPDTGYTLSQVTVNGDADLVSANIKSGANIFGVAGKASVVDTSDANAVAGNILSGKTAYVNGSKITGTIASKGAQTYTPGTSNQTISAGQYLSGAQTIAGDADLVAGNIKSGVNIFGVAGTLPVYSTFIDSVQTGSVTYSSSNVDVSLSTVVPARCMILLNSTMSLNWSEDSTQRLFNSLSTTTLQLSPSGSYVTTKWTVVQFASGVIKSIQRGSSYGTSITHSSVNVNKSFVLINNQELGVPGGAVETACVISRTSTSLTTNKNIYNYGGGGYEARFNWQIIEFY